MVMIQRNLRYKTVAWQWLAVLFVAFVLFGQPAQAAVMDFRVVGIGNGNSSLEAEQAAIDYAKKRAVFLAARKFGMKDPAKAIAKFDAETFQAVIRGVNVTNSRRVGETTYLDVQVTIVEDALRRILKLPDAIQPSPNIAEMRGVMLLVMLVGKERSYMWEKENILRAPVSDEVRRQSHGRILMPGGDLQDLRLIDYQNALTVEAKELAPMFERYGADEILIAAAKLSEPGTTDATNIILRRIQPDQVRNEVIDIPPESIEETSQSRMDKAVNAIAGAVTEIASSTAEKERVLREKAPKLTIRFRYAIPKELARMQEVLRASPDVLFLDVPSIALARVSGTVYLKGDEKALRDYLTKSGIIIADIKDGWQLSVR